MRIIYSLVLTTLLLHISPAQQTARPEFEVASVKRSAGIAGRDARGRFIGSPAGLSAHNVSLEDAIVQAYRVERWQFAGGPGWIDSDEFDIEARTGRPVSDAERASMLQTLLADRFHLTLHREDKELRGYALVVDQNSPNSPKLDHAAVNGRKFRGDFHDFARFLSVQLTIPPLTDPSRPSIASGNPIVVIDETGITGIHEFSVDMGLETGTDMFVLWQRVLREQLGLRLDARKVTLECLIVDHADRTPATN